jgi:hypothetical protein
MTLPNFILDPGLRSLKRMMGIPDDALGVLDKEVDINILTASEWAELEDQGKEVALADIRFLPDGTLGYKNSRILLYIFQPSQNPRWGVTLPKYHVLKCQKIEEMWGNNRKDRYVVATKSSGEFTLRFGNDGQWREETHRLDVCRYCLGVLDHKSYSAQPKNVRNQIVADFTPQDFFSQYPKTHNFDSKPRHTESNPPPNNDYPTDWDKISNRLKEAHGWKCQSNGCGRVLKGEDSRFLHVHHRNGLKYDCKPSNLMVLCLEHHAGQPLHNHLKGSPDYRAFTAKYGRNSSSNPPSHSTHNTGRKAEGKSEFLIKLKRKSLRNIENYLPQGFITLVSKELSEAPSLVYVTSQRKSKHGDHKVSPCKRYSIITVNHNDNHYRFTITLLHELAHAKTRLKYGPKADAHGFEWKKTFSDILIECAVQKVFPSDLNEAVKNHARNPMHSSSVDHALEMALRRHDVPDDWPTAGDLPVGARFSLDGQEILIKVENLRKRVRCKSLSGTLYTVSKVAKVQPLS